MNRALAFLALFVFGAVIFSGCIQEQEANRGEPPQAAFVPLVKTPQHDIVNVSTPIEEETAAGCDPPIMENYCGENQTRYYDLNCTSGEWEYKTQKCAYECREGECVRTGCPPCDDQDPCTMDLCSGGPIYECIHIPDAACQGPTQKACKPVAPAGSIVIDVYPAGAGTGATPQMSQSLYQGERMWIDEDDFISFQAFVLQGSCPQCFYPPLMKWPPSAQLYITKDLSGKDGTYLEDEGEFSYICTQGYCRNANPGSCTDYVCNTTMKFVVSKMNINLTCT